MFADGSGNVNAKLAKLNAGDVAGYQVGQSGNNWVMTFTLKSGVNATNANHGVSGYMYFLTMQEVSDVIVNIGKAIGGDSFKIEINKAKSSITLNGGKLVVNVDKNTGKITTATLSFTEDINGQCKALGSIPVTANLQGKGTVTFTYA